MSEYDYLFKIIIVGDYAVGKSAIMIRFCEDRFEEHHKDTIGADFTNKVVEVSGYKIKMQVWDTASQKRFSPYYPLYYKGAMAFLALFDLTNRKSYEILPKFFVGIEEICGRIPIVLIGNKADLPDRAVSTGEAQALSEKMGFQYYETSAKTGLNVYQIFEKLARMVLSGTYGLELNKKIEFGKL